MSAAPEICQVLVVDDDPDVLAATVRTLERGGFSTLSTLEADQVIPLIQAEKPDLVLLDVVMGEADGVHICRAIKELAMPDRPLVILASHMRISSIDQVHGLHAGADGYLTRPVTGPELVAHLQAYARLKKERQDQVNRAEAQARKEAALSLDQERRLRAEMERDLTQVLARMERQKQRMEEQAIAMRVLMEQMQNDRVRLQDHLVHNLRNCVQPLIRRMLKGDMDPRDLDLLNERIDQIVEPFGQQLDNPEFGLTAREKEVCNLIQSGYASKDIAQALHLSVHTVNTHRNRIRRKLKLEHHASLEQALKNM